MHFVYAWLHLAKIVFYFWDSVRVCVFVCMLMSFILPLIIAFTHMYESIYSIFPTTVVTATTILRWTCCCYNHQSAFCVYLEFVVYFSLFPIDERMNYARAKWKRQRANEIGKMLKDENLFPTRIVILSTLGTSFVIAFSIERLSYVLGVCVDNM